MVWGAWDTPRLYIDSISELFIHIKTFLSNHLNLLLCNSLCLVYCLPFTDLDIMTVF